MLFSLTIVAMLGDDTNSTGFPAFTPIPPITDENRIIARKMTGRIDLLLGFVVCNYLFILNVLFSTKKGLDQISCPPSNQ